MRRAMVLAVVVLCLAPAVASAAGRPAKAPAGLVLYVATNGNDAWSGRLPAPNAKRTDGPFSSITRARDAIRKLKAGDAPAAPVTVRVRAGTYYLPETVAFTPEDSGSKECPITYAAYPGETPVLSGGRRVTGWRPYKGSIVCADLPDVKAGKWLFRSLFADGARQVRARCPNFDPANPYRKGFLYAGMNKSAFGISVGNIHNVGDWMDYRVAAPAEGDYRVWVYYGAENKPFGNDDMGGRTTMAVDGGVPAPLERLPDTGGWGTFRWSESAVLHLAQGERLIRWQNNKGGGLNLEAFAFSDDPGWKPISTDLPKVAEGKHALVVQAESFVASHGRQLSVGGSGAGSPKEFYYDEGTLKPSWASVPEAEVHIFQSGNCRAFKEIVSIASVDTAERKVTLTGPECTSILHAGDRYFVENVLEELDSPGEWYLDRAAGVLYFWPPKPLTAESEVVAPVLQRVFEFLGDAKAGRTVSHIRLVGLTIGATDYIPGDGCTGYGMGSDGTVFLKDANECAVEECTFRNIGKYGICATGGGGHSLRRNDVSYGAEGGILISGSARNTLADNHLHHLGWVYKHIGGVIVTEKGSDENVVSHNAIHDVTRYGISIKNGGLRNVIEFNRVERTNTETYDTGGIEVTQGDREGRSGSAIRNNIVGDTVGYSSVREKPTYLSWGIYLDSFAGGYTVTNNICYRSYHGGIMFQGGKDNRVENNIFVDGRLNQGHICNFAGNSTGLVLERNIFAWADPDAVLFSVGKLDEGVIRVDRNLYFHAGEKPLMLQGGGMSTFADWHKRGYDTNGVVADPLFVDPAHDNYALKLGSPALKLGFRPIDTKGIGPRHKPCRCAPTPPDR